MSSAARLRQLSTNGRVFELRAGEMFYISPEPHDSWVLGNEPYVSLHLIGAGHYAKG